MPGHGLGDEERAAEVRVDDCVPVVPGDVDGRLADVAAGVVDEDVDLAELANASATARWMLAVVADVELDAGDPAAERPDLVGQRLERRGVRLVMTRSAPAWRAARAKFWPRPRLAPVTIATRSDQVERISP